MKGQMDTQYGQILIDTDVIATYAGSVAVECFGIVGMAAVNMKDGLVKLLKRDYLNHGINVKVDENNEITIDFHVIVAYGISIGTGFYVIFGSFMFEKVRFFSKILCVYTCVCV